MRQFLNSSERISPWPVSSTLKTSMVGDWGRRRIRHTPSSLIVLESPGLSVGEAGGGGVQREKEGGSHSRKTPAKLTHMSAFHEGLGRELTVCGIRCVSISSRLARTPSRVRKPTMILGTPSRNDWIQNFMSLRWKTSASWGPRISTDVLSSTQLIGAPFSTGFESQTGGVSRAQSATHGDCKTRVDRRRERRMDVLASTSPPRHRVALPIPVRTTEQYCSLLLTMWFSRSSMYSRDVSAQGVGRVARASNL